MWCTLYEHSTEYILSEQAGALIVYTLSAQVGALTMCILSELTGALTICTISKLTGAVLVHPKVYNVSEQMSAPTLYTLRAHKCAPNF